MSNEDSPLTCMHTHAFSVPPSPRSPPLSPSLSQVLVAVQRRQADQEARGTVSAAAGPGGAALDAEVRYGLMRLVRGLAGDKEIAVGFEEALAEAWRALWGEIPVRMRCLLRYGGRCEMCPMCMHGGHTH